MVTPYQDALKQENTWQRTFEAHVPDSELIWHQDRNTRQVMVVEGENWQLQLDNQLPEIMMQGATYVIPARMYHRLIKGDSDLIIKISECESTHQE